MSRRPALAALLLLTLVSCAAWDLDSWAARIAVWTLMYAVVQVVGDLDRLRLEQSGAGKDAPYERW